MKFRSLFVRAASAVLLLSSFGANSTVISVDHGDAGFSSTGFTASTWHSGYEGSNYLVDTVNVAGDLATWDPTGVAGWVAGLWNVEVIWTAAANRATAANFSVNSMAGVNSVAMNQTMNNATWMSLGTYNFSMSSASVMLDDSNSTPGQYVIADAVRFTLLQPATIPEASAFLLMLAGVAGMLRLRKK